MADKPNLPFYSGLEIWVETENKFQLVHELKGHKCQSRVDWSMDVCDGCCCTFTDKTSSKGCQMQGYIMITTTMTLIMTCTIKFRSGADDV